jgi:hypothetical protein
MDQLSTSAIKEVEARLAEAALEDQGPLLSEEEAEEVRAEVNAFNDIPEEFRPRTGRQAGETSSEPGVGPVKVNFVTIDSSGKLYLLSAETGKIYVYGPDESFLFSFGTKGGSPRQLSQPRALVIDEKRELIYVVDYMRHTILVYNKLNGEYIFEIGGRGFAPGWFNFPTGIALNNQQQIVVADLFNKRVQVLEVGYDKSLFSDEDESIIEIMTDILGSGDGAEQVEAPSEVEQSEIEKENMLTTPLEQPPDVIEEVIIQDLQLPAEPWSTNAQEKPQQAPLESSSPGEIE